MTKEMTGRSLRQSVWGLPSAPPRAEVFDVWLSRSRTTLRFLACRMLGNPEEAEVAVHNCWLTASQERPRFDREGAFRSWLVRVLITEALTILHQDKYRLVSHRQTEPLGKPSQ